MRVEAGDAEHVFEQGDYLLFAHGAGGLRKLGEPEVGPELGAGSWGHGAAE